MDEPRRPARLNPAIPRDLETIVLKAMAKAPQDRYGTAQSLADDLGRFLSGEHIRAKRPGLVAQLGKWTGRQILAHLADAEIGVGFRARQALAEDHHTIQPFDEGAWARRYQDVDHEAALRSFLALRGWNIALFGRLAPEDLAREAYHPERGPETVGVIIRMLAGHDYNHLAQLERIPGA